MTNRRILLGMGTGRCGTRSLAGVLNRQQRAHVTHERKPLLPWRCPGPSAAARRLALLKQDRKGEVIGDVASFYLPYVESVIEQDPDVRIVCLRRPREEVIASFCLWLDSDCRLPTNHWAELPAPGWFHEPVHTRIYPQYETQDREEGIGQYWDEYYARADELARRFPQHVRIFDWRDCLQTEEGQREMLSFCGFSSTEQVITLGNHEYSRDDERFRIDPVHQAPALGSSDMDDPRRCVVLVPFYSHIERTCEEALQELERQGYPVRRKGGYAAIDHVRNKLATEALIEGFEETMWIDADVDFEPDAVQRLRHRHLPIVAGVCPKKGKQELALRLLPGTKKLDFGKHGGLTEIMYAGTGFLHVRRLVYERIQCDLNLPVCNEQFSHPLIPFFHPLILESGEGPWYLGEDWAFCERARQCGFQIMADSSIRLWHIGDYRYGWEDAARRMPRYADFTLNFDENGAQRESTINRCIRSTAWTSAHSTPIRAGREIRPKGVGREG